MVGWLGVFYLLVKGRTVWTFHSSIFLKNRIKLFIPFDLQRCGMSTIFTWKNNGNVVTLCPTGWVVWVVQYGQYSTANDAVSRDLWWFAPAIREYVWDKQLTLFIFLHVFRSHSDLFFLWFGNVLQHFSSITLFVFHFQVCKFVHLWGRHPREGQLLLIACFVHSGACIAPTPHTPRLHCMNVTCCCWGWRPCCWMLTPLAWHRVILFLLWVVTR